MSLVASYAVSDRGLVRSENEDSYLISVFDNDFTWPSKGVLAIVADGVGGAAEGKRASQTAVNTIRENYIYTAHEPGTELIAALREANRVIYQEAQEDPQLRGMATTCTAVALSGESAYIAHIGDSRAYLFHDGVLSQITEDHSLVNQLISQGLLKPEQRRNHPQKNIIVRALGSRYEAEIDLYHVRLSTNDTLLICSDGLSDMVTEEEIAAALDDGSLSPAGKRLIQLANDRGGKDNITVVFLRVCTDSAEVGQTNPYGFALPDKKAHPTKKSKSHLMAFILIAVGILAMLGCLFYTQVKVNSPPRMNDMIKIIK